jgi:hypothetical protein
MEDITRRREDMTFIFDDHLRVLRKFRKQLKRVVIQAGAGCIKT